MIVTGKQLAKTDAEIKHIDALIAQAKSTTVMNNHENRLRAMNMSFRDSIIARNIATAIEHLVDPSNRQKLGEALNMMMEQLMRK